MQAHLEPAQATARPKFNRKFTSSLRLAPNNKISGDNVLRNQIGRWANRFKIALRWAANCIAKSLSI
ncbi:MAG: hypothetical protein IPL31_12880 [Saprospiraceae bacterium]|nr:hypothetical protein [Saprospiraceae bacterium]